MEKLVNESLSTLTERKTETGLDTRDKLTETNSVIGVTPKDYSRPKENLSKVCSRKGIEYETGLKVKYVNKNSSKYYFLDVYKKELLSLHKNDFNRRDLPCINKYNVLCKYKGARSDAENILKKLYSKHIFTSEGLTESLTGFKKTFQDFLSGICTIFETIALVGKVSTAVNTTYSEFKEKFLQPITNIDFAQIKKYGFKILKLLISIKNLLSHDHSGFLDYVSILLSIQDILSETPLFSSESLETVLIAGVSTLMPIKIITILKQMSILTNKKLLDDHGIFIDFFSCLGSLLNCIIEFFPNSIQEYMKELLSIFGLQEFVCVQKCKVLLKSYEKDKKIMLKDSFRNSVKDLENDSKLIVQKKFFSKNKALNDLSVDFIRLCKNVHSYEETSRIEPSCFVFEGPPGCRKSVTVNNIIKVLGQTHYSHSVKNVEDGKDWYDSYNNETIFYMDDVGQMGKNQWRTLINWVSCVKLPLDCAEASLKDTKYFNSEIILLTTNNFMHLSGFTSKDCIENPEALWRRGFVFDFQEVKTNGSSLIGVARFKYYDIDKKKFINGFPLEFRDFCALHEVTIQDSCRVEDQSEFLVWSTSIIQGINKMRKEQHVNNNIDEEDLSNIRNLNPFYSEGEEPDGFLHSFYDYCDYLLEVLKDFVADALKLIYENPMLVFGGISVGILLLTIVYKFRYKNFQQESNLELETLVPKKILTNDDKFTNIDLDSAHSMLRKISKQLFEIEMSFTVNDECYQTNSCLALISGRYVLVPYHLVLDRKIQLTVFRNKQDNYRFLDNAPVDVVYKNAENDVAILKISSGFPTPFKKISVAFKENTSQPVGLAFPDKIISLNDIIVNNYNDGPIVYNVGKNKNIITNPCVYKDLHYKGMCGALVVTQQGQIIGMHVAGSDDKSLGASLVWSDMCRRDIFNILEASDKGLKINVNISERSFCDTSGLRIDSDLSVYVPKNTNFIKSPLFGTFETTRQPANLSVYGPHTVKDLAKSSREIGSYCNQNELDYAEEVLSQYFEDYDDLSEEQVVKGDEWLAPINKKSSNGLFDIKSKEDCFDFIKGEFKSNFRNLYNEFVTRMRDGEILVKDIVWFETVKDELRNIEKTEPRSFRVSPVTMQVATKMLFGKMAVKILKEKWFNEIMIGINPFKDWQRLYNMMKVGRCWAGDIGKYDKRMKVQVQDIVAKVILKYYKGRDKQLAENILNNISYNIVVVNDDTWVLNHSLPSGCWLTALFNSLVNRAYTAMWYYRYMVKNKQKVTATSFHRDITDPVYGDDRLNVCLNKKFESFLNAETMRDFFESLGMTMTDSFKNPIVKPFQDLSEITFLKRSFRYHPVLNTITCPLDVRTVYSSLSWVDKSKEELYDVILDKINAFQREIFLHYDLYHRSIQILEKACLEQSIPFKLLSEQYLKQIYDSGEYDLLYHASHNFVNPL